MGDRNRAPPNIDGMVTLKVDNITYDTRAEEIKDLFRKYGDIGDTYIPRDHYTGQSRGFAFVRFADRRDAEDALERMDGKSFRGRELRIQWANHRRPDNPRAYYSSGGHRRRRSPSPYRRRSRSRSRDRRRSRSRSNDRWKPARSRERDASRSRSRGRSKGDDRNKADKRSRSRTPDKAKDRDDRDSRSRGRTNRSPVQNGKDNMEDDKETNHADERPARTNEDEED